MPANQLKSTKPKPAPKSDSVMKKDKEPDVNVKSFVKDERTHKVAGMICLLMAAFLFIAFISYLYTWKADQKIISNNFSDVFFNESGNVQNLLGRLGAYTSHLFFFNGAGIASFLFCYLFLILGVNSMTGRRIFKIGRNIRYIIFGLIFLSTAFAFIFHAASFPWGGAMGNMISHWLTGFLGQLGTSLLILVCALAFLVWKYNFDFRIPHSLRKRMKSAATASYSPGIDDTANSEQEVVPQPLGRDPLPEDQKEDSSIPMSLSIKENIPSKNDTNEVEPEPPVNPEPAAANKRQKPVSSPEELALEINPVHEEEPKNIPEKAAKLVKEQGLYEPTLDLQDYRYPTFDLLENYGGDKIVHDSEELENNKRQIIETLNNYDITIQKITATVGPTVTLYEIVPAAGIRISRIRNLEDDIALSLAALGIRIIAPIPGKGTIGIEVPNVKRSIVSMKTLLASDKFQNSRMLLPIALGKKIDNENFIVDLTAMPHLLMAGATGQGKSVGINAILVSLLYKKHPSQLKFILVDPKKVELSIYRVIEKYFLAKLPGEEESIITDTKKVVHTLNALCIEMDNRYDLLKDAGVRNIKEYNDKFVHRRLNPKDGHQYLPFLVLVIDEFADLIMTAGKEVEMPIARLAQLARAVGIHLIIATQRPSVNIITGVIKANFPARVAFKVSSKVDSRTILDAGGAEQLIGKGDMLISYNGDLTRLQCAFVDTPEVENVVTFISDQKGYPQPFMLPEYVDEKEMEKREYGGEKDPLFVEAAQVIVATQQGSTSLLQRRMKLGYNRAGRLMDQLEAAGIVGANAGSKAREVLVKTEPELQEILQQMI
ncbi:MAG: DNA translocase FtsK [Chitinophagaceae bacterium]|nr:MAG: DNA translocase FtsK [Chitinophagaceae bacterium]